MNDKELLENAAKAAGYEFKLSKTEVGVDTPCIICRKGINPALKLWRPLEDDADAFRLMVDAELAVEIYPDFIYVFSEDCDPVRLDYNNEKHAATRRAIVECAAQRISE